MPHYHSWFRSTFYICLLLVAVFQVENCDNLLAQNPLTSPGNIALGKPYTFSRPPNYQPCQDSDDQTQLTDGLFTKGRFWTQKSTVGWSGGQPVLISIDLGRIEPIRGFAFSTAGGDSDVNWPYALMLMVSDDGKQWYSAGDMLTLSAKHGTPPIEGYGTHIYRTDELKTHGRYVQIGVLPTESDLFAFSVVDEIEIVGGDRVLLDSDRGPAYDDPIAIVQASKITRHLGSQFRTDIDKVRASIESDATPQPAKAKLLEQVEQFDRRLNSLPVEVRQRFKAVLPMSDLERDIFGLQAEVWREQGKDAMRVWKTHRWDMLGPTDEPPVTEEPLKLHVDLMNGEHRADVLNITVADSKEVEVRVRIEGLPGGTNPDYVTPYEVLCVGTRHLGAISSPLPRMKKQGDSFGMTIVPGMTRQIWFDFHPVDFPPGQHQGQITLQVESGIVQRIPIDLVVWPWEFPKQASLLTGGWTYANGQNERGISPENRDALIDFLQDYHVTSPWATRAALPEGKYDEQGNLTQSPSTSNFDAWVKRWPNAKRYMVYFAVSGGYTPILRTTFAGSEPGTDLFEKKLASWAHFWANHMRKIGLQPSQLGLCIFDEPNKKEQYELLTIWSKAIEQAEPDFIAWVDPHWKIKDDSYLPMMAKMDEVVMNRRLWKEHLDWYPDLFATQQREGRKLGFYHCAGPARSFDPYAYYLLQAWHTFQIDGIYSGFWSFSDTRGADPWNDFSASLNGSFCPFYLLEADVMTDKRMEAVREGAQDFECLVMLRDRVEHLEAAGQSSPSLTKARALLDSACKQVLIDFESTNFRWDKPADRTVADKIRVDILTAYAALSED